MSQENISQAPNKNSICDAANCSSKALVQIEVKVGQLGTITLALCNDCVSKFRDE
jgi:hypothetical protein